MTECEIRLWKVIKCYGMWRNVTEFDNSGKSESKDQGTSTRKLFKDKMGGGGWHNFSSANKTFPKLKLNLFCNLEGNDEGDKK